MKGWSVMKKAKKIPPGSPGFKQWAMNQPVRFSCPFESEAAALAEMDKLVCQPGRGPGQIFYVTQHKPGAWAVMSRLTKRSLGEIFDAK